jgi:hypothetical protein
MDRSITLAVDVDADPTRVSEILSSTDGQRAFWTADCDVWADRARFGFAQAPVDLETTAQRANPVYAARFTHLTTRGQNKLTVTQAQAVIAAAILRQLHAVITTGQRWNPLVATHGTKHPAATPVAA